MRWAHTVVTYDPFIGIEMDVDVESGNGEGFVPDGVNKRTEALLSSF